MPLKEINVFGITDGDRIKSCDNCAAFIPYVDGDGNNIYGICHRYPEPLKIAGENCRDHWCEEFREV